MCNLLPFNIDKAKAGEPVVTRDGRKARIVVYDRIPSTTQSGTLIALVKTRPCGEQVMYYDEFGRCMLFDNSHLDLFHPEPEMWINVYSGKRPGPMIHNSKAEAAAIGGASSKDGLKAKQYRLVEE